MFEQDIRYKKKEKYNKEKKMYKRSVDSSCLRRRKTTPIHPKRNVETLLR
jgi:hypothetical protein